MSDIAPGWYPDPVDPDVQRYWDGEQWLGEPIPVAATPPATPPAPPATPPAPPATPPAPPAAAPTPPSAATPSDATVPAGSPGAAMPWAQVGGRVMVHGRELAPLSARLMARFIDFLAVTGLNLAVNGWFMYQWFREILPMSVDAQRWLAGEIEDQPLPSDRAVSLFWAMLVTAMALWFAYEVPAIAWRGQTLGKRLFEIKVLRYDGELLGFGGSFSRWFVMALPNLAFPWLAPLQIADALWCTWDRPLRQCLHDKRARGVVVRLGPADRAVAPASHDEYTNAST
ncbi:MAG TPA: RDD family protein [Micromonosporaceae bacterium]|nr:RDD family protein [Micromonosporaceae bacterium]